MELRVLCRQYYQWSDLFGDLQTHFRTVLDLLFPGYDKVFHKIHNAASLELLSNFPTPQDVLSADRTDLLRILKQTMIRSYCECIAKIETQMQSLAESIDAYSLLRTIPGVGLITAAIIVAEIGDIKRFPSSEQLTAFAGLDSSVYESGTFKAKQNRITKRGSVYLRTALYQAILELPDSISC